MIPKIIHYCWLSDNIIPVKFQSYISTWKSILFDYEFIIWDLKRFDLNNNIWVKEAFENKKYAFAADYIRIYAIYSCGGIYLDMDVEIIKPFTKDVLNKGYILGYESNECNTIEGGIIGGEKGAEWLKECLSYYDNKHFIISTNKFEMRTLPNILFEQLDSKYIQTSILEIYSYDFFTAKSWLTKKINITENTFTVHHFEGSWISVRKKIRNLIAAKFINLKLNFIVILIIKVKEICTRL